jgi:cytidylate kinase
MIVAIDGPAASGKGTLGKRLAQHFGFRHLDTGLLYRAVAKSMIDAGYPLEDRVRAAEMASALDPASFQESALKRHDIGEAASVISAIPQVREALVAFQRSFAAQPPGAVLDGRDIGTVICPDADVKIFVTATPDVRSSRRFLEMQSQGSAISLSEVQSDIARRDERDRARAIAPLVPALDARMLDTTHMNADEALAAAIEIVEARRR